MKLNGAQILIKMIKAQGVDTIFGYPGGATIDIYDALEKQDDIRHVLVRHEQAAVHAADGYSRTHDTTGVALVTSGPGATNTITGLASAHSDSIPMVVFTGQVPTALIGNDAFQEVDIMGITRPCTKHNYLVKDPDKLAATIQEAFFIARSGRPGPVLVDLPKNILQAEIEFQMPGETQLRSYKPNYKPNKKQLAKVVSMIKNARKPVIFAGGGVISSGASEQITRLAQMTEIPVTGSLMGLGAFPGSHPLWLGMLGMHGTFRANMSIGTCDLILAAGVRFDDRVTGNIEKFAPHAKIAQIDIDPTSIHKNIEVQCPIVADCKTALEGILQLLEKEDPKNLIKERKAWLDQIEEWKQTTPLKYEQEDKVIKPQFVVEKLYEVTKGEAIISTEVGQNQMWAAQFYHFDRPNHFLTSGGLGVMGFGLPAAIGAKAACPDKTVVDIAGDGSIQMNIQELMTAIESGLDVKIVILNNRFLGMVRQWQEIFYEKVYASTPLENSPDFVKLAEAYGAKGFRCDDPARVQETLALGIDTPGTVIMEFIVDREESVYPMVPAGGALTEMLLV
ncbi:biosynthetic-type acetolactate synthase large subunit [Desulfospira joergensenii]|uniref:biosynthetic-type acetolactate synthase large subunit n=1 Tax=Desulfospira joergensenii TaxID=53329 RepID=UPI0003B3F4D7|nr:biosynthetic-type acetolactate synthase large subunit [Desulfospira joergensenii]